MEAGKLRNYITIEQATLSAPDAFGTQKQTWTTYAANVPAQITSLMGRELGWAKSYAATASLKIIVRYNPSAPITALHRATLATTGGSRIFLINAALDPDQRLREQILICTEIIGPPTQS